MKFPLPPKPVRGLPSKADIIEDKRGSTTWLTANSGFECMQAQHSSPTSDIAPGRIFVFKNLEIFLIAYSVRINKNLNL